MTTAPQYLGTPDTELSRNSPDDIRLPVLRDFLGYWEERCDGARWPARTALDPLELKPLLGHIAILEVIDPGSGHPPRFRYRLFGTAFVEWFGFDMTGRTIDDWPQPEYRDHMNASYREVVAEARPFRRYRSFIKDGRLLHYEGLMLPVGNPRQIEQIVVAQFFLD